MTILIVDDEPIILQGIVNGIQWDILDFQKIITAKNYEQAKNIIGAEPVDVLLTDIEMTDKNGLDLIQWINEQDLDMKCIVLSCHDRFEFAQRAVRLECFDYILKPVPYETLTQDLLRAQNRIRQERGQLLLESYGRDYVKKLSEPMKMDLSEDTLEIAKAYIQAHISEDTSVEALAKEVHVSPRHLSRLFQKEFRKSVGEYITDQRMLLAGELLRTTGLTVTLVSDRVGYSNYSYFIKQFKRFYGLTPKEYQRRFEK